MTVYRAPAALVAAVFTVAAGCSHVSQDAFDQSMADMQSQLSAQEGRIDSNSQDIASLRADLDGLQAELEQLAEDYQAMTARYEDYIRFAAPVHFDFDSSDVRDSDREFLDRFAMVLSHHYPGATVTVEGFADPAGPAQYNDMLSRERAQNVAGYLVETGGLDAASVSAVGYGEARLVAPGEWGESAGGMQNRRVTFVVESAG